MMNSESFLNVTSMLKLFNKISRFSVITLSIRWTAFGIFGGEYNFSLFGHMSVIMLLQIEVEMGKVLADFNKTVNYIVWEHN